MVTRAAKDLLRNTIRSTDYHNRLLEEDEMWRQWDMERGLTMMVTDDCLKKRLRMDEYPKPTKRVTRREHDNEPGTSDNAYWTRKFFEAEERDPDRWGHSGYKELYPEEFKNARKSRSVSVNSRNSSSPIRHKTKKKSKKHKLKKRHKRKREYSDCESESDKDVSNEHKRKRSRVKHKQLKVKNNQHHERTEKKIIKSAMESPDGGSSSGDKSPVVVNNCASDSDYDGHVQNNRKHRNNKCETNSDLRKNDLPDNETLPEKTNTQETDSETNSSKLSESNSTEEEGCCDDSESASDDKELRQRQLERLARFRRHFRSCSMEKEGKDDSVRTVMDAVQTISRSRSKWTEHEKQKSPADRRISQESDWDPGTPKCDWQKTTKRRRHRRRNYLSRKSNRS